MRLKEFLKLYEGRTADGLQTARAILDRKLRDTDDVRVQTSHKRSEDGKSLYYLATYGEIEADDVTYPEFEALVILDDKTDKLSVYDVANHELWVNDHHVGRASRDIQRGVEETEDDYHMHAGEAKAGVIKALLHCFNDNVPHSDVDGRPEWPLD